MQSSPHSGTLHYPAARVYVTDYTPDVRYVTRPTSHTFRMEGVKPILRTRSTWGNEVADQSRLEIPAAKVYSIADRPRGLDSRARIKLDAVAYNTLGEARQCPFYKNFINLLERRSLSACR